jgi:alkylation response protein AidB-like acyl-CoA dehydrogenase
MQLARSEEQDELARTVRALLDKRSDSAAVRAALDSADGFDRALWQTLCEQIGVAALPVPEEYAGVGASFVETAIVLEETGRNLTPSPLLATGLATAALLLHGRDEDRAALLPRIAVGEIATLVWSDPAGDLVLDGAAADIVLRVEADALTPVEERPAPVPSLDPTTRWGLAAGEPGPADLVDLGRALTTAVQVGVAQRGLDMTVAYSKERVQFGRPIGSFQALKHRMADLLVLVESARSASWGATAAAAAYVADPSATNAATLHLLAATAKAWCSDALAEVASETVQLHGGIAITWEHDAHLVLKRAHLLGQLFGPAHRVRADLV